MMSMAGDKPRPGGAMVDATAIPTGDSGSRVKPLMVSTGDGTGVCTDPGEAGVVQQLRISSNTENLCKKLRTMQVNQ